METTWLARQFIKQREIIEAAETPFAKLAVFVLPIIAPLVPAFMTGVHLFSLFIVIFTFSGADVISKIMAGIIALVLELLGYVGAISAIKSLFTWVKEKRVEHLVPVVLNGIAYLFYLLSIVLVNFYLGNYLGEDGLVTGIIGLLSLITVPTGLLAANHLNESADREITEKKHLEQISHDDMVRREKNNLNLEKYKIRYGVPNTSESILKVSKQFQNTSGSNSKMGRPSVHLEQVFSYMEENYSKTGSIPSFTEVVSDLKLPPATASRLRKEWIEMKRKNG